MYLKIKRFFDVCVVLLAAPLWLPLMGCLCLIVKLSSKGPVFFTQKRFMKDCHYFTIYKFRSMYADAPKDVPTHLLQNPQVLITPVGRFLRKSSLDELPQLFNILRGELSLVGPRPALYNQEDLIAEREKYGANGVPVGLTGYAQIMGRDELEITEKAALDGEYVKRMSFTFDCYILVRTFFNAIFSKGVVEGAKKIQ